MGCGDHHEPPCTVGEPIPAPVWCGECAAMGVRELALMGHYSGGCIHLGGAA